MAKFNCKGCTERHVGCSLCNTDEIEKLLTLKRNGKIELGFVGGISVFPPEDHASFCPNCGRKLVKKC